MKLTKKLLMPLSILTIATSIAPVVTSCSSTDEDPYVILPTKQVQVTGEVLVPFTFQIKDKGTIYDHIDATVELTSSSRDAIKAKVVSSTITSEQHIFTVIVKIYHENSNHTVTGGDFVAFNLNLKCYRANQTNPDWETTTKGYRIDYKAPQTTNLFEIDSESSGIKTIEGWASSTTTNMIEENVAANDGVFEFPYAINKISNTANLSFPDNCKAIRFRKDSNCNAIYGKIDASVQPTKAAPGSFDLSKEWHVKTITINPSMVTIGDKNYYDSTKQLNQVVFPSLPDDEKNNVCIDVSSWTANDIAKIATPKSPSSKTKPANTWTWSNDAFYNYKVCQYSVIKVKAGTRDVWFDYFGYTAGFKFFDSSTREKRWWRIEEVE